MRVPHKTSGELASPRYLLGSVSTALIGVFFDACLEEVYPTGKPDDMMLMRS